MVQQVISHRSFVRIVILFMCLFVVNGCSTTQGFSHTPTVPAEFYKPLDELKRSYSDIEKYDRIFAGPSSSPKKDELQEMWGEPEVKKKWVRFLGGVGLGIGLAVGGWLPYPVLGAIYLLAPTPREEYVWKKGNYEITAQGRSDMLVGYEKRICGWDWEEKRTQEAVQQIEQ